jgi:hypothetical protein
MSEVCHGREKIPALLIRVVAFICAPGARTFVTSLRRCQRTTLLTGALAALGALAPAAAYAQQMDPRSYANVPIDLNFLLAGYAYSWGDVVFDPSVPITNADAKVNAVYLGYIRSLDFWGQSGTLGLVLPYASVNGRGTVEDQTDSIVRSGYGDVALRLSVNLYGAPALSLPEFRNYRQDLIVGASLLVTAPTGRYYPDKVVNIGTNRWSFKPEVGVSKGLGNWILEGALGVTFYTDNDEFYPGNAVRQQDPLYATQAHVIYNFSPALWASFDMTYYVGGSTSVNGVPKADLQQNVRWGATVSQALDRYNSLKLYSGTGAVVRAGTKFNTVGVVWQYRWGAGL